MVTVTIPNGDAEIVSGSVPITPAVFGYNYTAFRSFDRFDAQLNDGLIGLICWPGGSLAEHSTDKYGLEYKGLWNGAGRPGLDDLFAEAAKHNAAVSVVMPTLRYFGNAEQLKQDVSGFMADLLGGEYGDLPPRMILEIGSEFYATFGTGPTNAKDYGKIANLMIEEISACLQDLAINPSGLDVEIACQTGRSPEEDEILRAQLSDTSLENVDMLIHHRFAKLATGADRSIEVLSETVGHWSDDMLAVGGHEPKVYLSGYNVASLTRGEALARYVDDMAEKGVTIDPDAINVDARTDVGFERYWQNALTGYHYGVEQSRVLVEILSHVGSVGLGAAAVYGVDMQYPARLTWTGADGQGYDFVGQDFLDMMAESVIDTRMLKVSVQNDTNGNLWTYAFENDDKLIVFVAWHGLEAGPLEVEVPGIERHEFKAVWADRLTAEVPDDWMTRFDIPDNPSVDETPESLSFAFGVREALVPQVTDHGVEVKVAAEHEIVRLSFAKTDAGLAEIHEWAFGDPAMLDVADPTLAERVAAFLTGEDAFAGLAKSEADLMASAGATDTLAEDSSEDTPAQSVEHRHYRHQHDQDDPADGDFSFAIEGFVGALIAIPILGILF